MVGIFCGYGSGVGIELGLQWKFPTASVAYASQHQWVKNNVSMRVCVLSFQIQNRHRGQPSNKKINTESKNIIL